MAGWLNRLLGLVIGLLGAAAPIGHAWAAPPDQLVVFGDSLSDPGNAFAILKKVAVPPFSSLIPDAPYARGGLHFSNGATWVEQLSVVDTALPSSGPALAQPKLFANYSVGGARARLNGPFDLTAQINRFLIDFGGLGSAAALYVVWIGGDDVRDAVQALATDPTGITSAAIEQQAVLTIKNGLLTLYGAGARRFLVLNIPDLGLTPEARLLGPQVQAAATYLASQFNAGLQQVLLGAQAGLPDLQLVTLDIFALLHEVTGAPAAFGLTDVTNPCIVVNSSARPYCPNAGAFLFWDGAHPTVAGHRIVAQHAAAAMGLAWPH